MTIAKMIMMNLIIFGMRPGNICCGLANMSAPTIGLCNLFEAHVFVQEFQCRHCHT